MDAPLSKDVAPPIEVEKPFGSEVDFRGLVEASGMRLVVSMAEDAWPHVWLHDKDEQDYIVRGEGRPIYVVSVAGTPEDDMQTMSREALRRLAYGLQEWAAFEVVERYHRDLERKAVADQEPQP